MPEQLVINKDYYLFIVLQIDEIQTTITIITEDKVTRFGASVLRKYHLCPEVVSYTRFVELEREVAIPLFLFIKKILFGKCTGIGFVGSTPWRIYRNLRIHILKVFKGIAPKGQMPPWLVIRVQTSADLQREERVTRVSDARESRAWHRFACRQMH